MYLTDQRPVESKINAMQLLREEHKKERSGVYGQETVTKLDTGLCQHLSKRRKRCREEASGGERGRAKVLHHPPLQTLNFLCPDLQWPADSNLVEIGIQRPPYNGPCRVVSVGVLDKEGL